MTDIKVAERSFSLIRKIILFQILLILAIGVYIYTRKSGGKDYQLNSAVITKEEVNCNLEVLNNYCEPIPNSIWRDTGSGKSNIFEYNINSNGFNAVKNYNLDKPTDTFRIMAIGDSHTFGLYVDSASNYPSLLEKQLINKKCGTFNNYEVLNLGFPGDDPTYTSYRYIKNGKKYSPDLIIWYLKSDDFKETTDDIVKLKDDCEREHLVNSNDNPINCWSEAYKKYYSAEGSIKTINDNIDKNIEVVKEFVDSVTNIPVIIFTYKDEDDKILKSLKTLSYKNVRLLYSLSYKDIERFDNDNHPKVAGYEAIARVLEKYISSDILRCDK